MINNAILAGFGLLVLSLLIPFVVGERRQWTNSQAVKFQEASHNYHAALHAAAHGSARTEPASTVLDKARREYEKYESMLVAAQTRGQRIARTLRWLGIVLCCFGFAGRLGQRFELFGKPSAS